MKRLQCVQYMRGLGDMRDWVHQPFRILRSICGVDDDGPCDSFSESGLPPLLHMYPRRFLPFYGSTLLRVGGFGGLVVNV